MTTQAYLSELFSLDGRVAVVAGGRSGIGLAIASALARAGASIVVVARGKRGWPPWSVSWRPTAVWRPG